MYHAYTFLETELRIKKQAKVELRLTHADAVRLKFWYECLSCLIRKLFVKKTLQLCFVR